MFLGDDSLAASHGSKINIFSQYNHCALPTSIRSFLPYSLLPYSMCSSYPDSLHSHHIPPCSDGCIPYYHPFSHDIPRFPLYPLLPFPHVTTITKAIFLVIVHDLLQSESLSKHDIPYASTTMIPHMTLTNIVFQVLYNHYNHNHP